MEATQAASGIAPALGVRKAAVFPVQYQGESQPFYTNSVLKELFDAANSYYLENSYGKMSYEYRILPPLLLPSKGNQLQSDGSCIYPGVSVEEEMQTAAATSGVDLSKYQAIVFAGSGCGSAGADISGTGDVFLEGELPSL